MIETLFMLSILLFPVLKKTKIYLNKIKPDGIVFNTHGIPL